MKRNVVQQQAAASTEQAPRTAQAPSQCQDSAKTTRGGPAITRRGKASATMANRPAKSASRKSNRANSNRRKSTGHKSASKAVMLPTDRIAYSPIPDRPPLQLPNGA